MKPKSYNENFIFQAILDALSDIKADVRGLSDKQDEISKSIYSLKEMTQVNDSKLNSLESKVLPLHESQLRKEGAKEAVEKYKLAQRERMSELMSKLKWPSLVASALAGVGSIIAILSGWF